MPNTRRDDSLDESPVIAIIMATGLEAKPVLDLLHPTQIEKRPCILYRRDKLILAVSGIGKASAAIATTYCCSLFRPSWVLNLGAAGATDTQCGRGGIFHVTTVLEPDRPYLGSNKPHVHVPEVLPGFREAVLATQDRPVIDLEDRKNVSVHASLVDMEGAAVVQAAHRFGIPCAVFKFVSDTPDDIDTDTITGHMKDHGAVFARFIVEKALPRLTRELHT
jgi:adenosylhomocysteine nucleosidase